MHRCAHSIFYNWETPGKGLPSLDHSLASFLLEFAATVSSQTEAEQAWWCLIYVVCWCCNTFVYIIIAINNVFYCIVLNGWSLLPNALRSFQIYCAPPNLGIRTWIFRLNFAQRSICQAWGSLTSLKSQTGDPQLKVPPGGLVLRILRPEKDTSIATGFELPNLGSSNENVNPRPQRPM